MSNDEWRVEIDLDDEQHGYSLGERFRSHDLDDEARKRLGRRAIVSRDGPRVFLYTGTEAQAREAEGIARELVASEELTADIDVTRWDADSEDWVYPSGVSAENVEDEPLPEEEYPWLLTIELESRGDASAVEDLLGVESGAPVHRRWHYVTADARTEEEADELANRVRDRLPEGAKMWVEANPEGIPNPAFVYLESRL
ncbi:MAG TPA: hypothetical protein VH420_10380 [Gaiellaceae bacterium]|jgi:hypothetical protein